MGLTEGSDRIAKMSGRLPGPIGGAWVGLTHEQEELALDLSQMVLDIVGAFEVPAADGANALISLGRKDWIGAGLSGLSMIPILGEIAKAGKIGKWVRTVNESIRVARTDSRFASLLRPALSNIRKLLAHIPSTHLPNGIGHDIEELKAAIDGFLRPARGLSKLDRLVDDLLIKRFGSVEHVGRQVRENVQIAAKFFESNGMKIDEMHTALNGIDLHAAEKIEVLTFEKGERVAEYVDTLKDRARQTGQWMVKERGAVSHRNLGLSGAGRKRRVFEVTEKVRVLKSKSAAVNDTWTLTVKSGGAGTTKVMGENAEMAAGGGAQYFLPNAYKFLKEVPVP